MQFFGFVFFGFRQQTVKFNTDFVHAEFSNCHDHVHQSAYRKRNKRKTGVWILELFLILGGLFGLDNKRWNSTATLGTQNFQIATTTCTQAHTEKRNKKKTNVWIWKFLVFCSFLWFGQRTVKFNTDFGHAEFSNCHDHVHPSAHRETKQKENRRLDFGVFWIFLD